MRASAIWKRNVPSNAVPASQATSSVFVGLPSAGSKATSFAPVAAQTRRPSWVTPAILSTPGNPYSRTISAALTDASLPAFCAIAVSLGRPLVGAVRQLYSNDSEAGSNKIVVNPDSGGPSPRRDRPPPIERTPPPPSSPTNAPRPAPRPRPPAKKAPAGAKASPPQPQRKGPDGGHRPPAGGNPEVPPLRRGAAPVRREPRVAARRDDRA